MKVLIMHPWAGLPARRELYSRLGAATGWKVRIVTTSIWKDEYGKRVKASTAPQVGSEVISVPVALSGNIPLHFFVGRLRNHVATFNPDLVYIYHEPYAAATFQMLRTAKAVANAPVGIRSAQNLFKRYPVPFRQSEKYVYENSDFAVVVSDNVARVMRQKGYNRPIEVIPMPVDLSVFTPGSSRVGEHTGALRVGFVGRLVPEKGLDTAIMALALTAPHEATLDVVGSGPDEARLRRLANELNVTQRIIWHGSLEREQVAVRYQQMDVVVMPSRRTARWCEQFGRVVIEAAAAGVPAIVGDSGELPVLVGRLGAGWVVGATDSEQLASTLRRLFRNRAELSAVGGRVRLGVQQDFSEAAVIDGLVAAFERALSRGRT